jgi:hypothetical protein
MIGEQAHHHVDRDGQTVMPAVLAVRATLLGYAIDCGVKCYWVKQGNKMVKNGKFIGVPGAGADQDLVQLARIVGYKPTRRDSEVLAQLSKFIRFAGRYPIAKHLQEMAPRIIDGLGKLNFGYFSKADFRTCLSVLNKLMTLISGKKRRSFQPLGTRHYLNRSERSAL